MAGLIDFYRKYKVEIWRFSIFSCGASTAHLNEMAAKGLRLVLICQNWLRIAVYRREEKPVEARFAVDVFEAVPDVNKGYDAAADEEQNYEQMYRDGGWLPIKGAKSDGLRFFVNDDPAAPLLYTDRDSEIVHMVEHAENNTLIIKRIVCGAMQMFIGWCGMAMEWIGFGVFGVIINAVMGILLALGAVKIAAAIANSIYVDHQQKRIENGQPAGNGRIHDKLDGIAEALVVMTAPIIVVLSCVAFGVAIVWMTFTINADEAAYRRVIQLIFGLALAGWVPLTCAVYPKAMIEESSTYNTMVSGVQLAIFGGLLLFNYWD